MPIIVTTTGVTHFNRASYERFDVLWKSESRGDAITADYAARRSARQQGAGHIRILPPRNAREALETRQAAPGSQCEIRSSAVEQVPSFDAVLARNWRSRPEC